MSLEHNEDNGIYFGDYSAATAAAAMAVAAAASRHHPTSNAHNSAKKFLIFNFFHQNATFNRSYLTIYDTRVFEFFFEKSIFSGVTA